MNPEENDVDFQPPIGLAGLACIGGIFLMIVCAQPLAQILSNDLAQLLASALIPLLFAFAVLYRSAWHREMSRLMRILFLLGSSCFLEMCILIAGLMLLFAFYVDGTRMRAFH